MKRKAIAVVFLWLMSFFQFGLSYAGTSAGNIILDGVHKFAPGDGRFWASPEYDDSKWRSISVPGSWQSQGIKPVNGLGWYRIHFTVPVNVRHINPALLLGRIGDADEVFLNGVKIGGEGLIGERFVEATKVERLYEIPPDLLRYNDTNILAVRVMNTYLNGGIFDKNSMIGDHSALQLEKFRRDKYIIIVEFCLLTFFALFFITCFFFYIKGLRDREYLHFWVFTSFYGILFLLGSLSFYSTGMKTPAIQQVITSLASLLPASLVLLLINVYKEKGTFYAKGLLLSFPVITVALIVFPGYTPRAYLYSAWKICFVLAALFIVFHAIRAFYKKFHESGPILLGITGLVIGSALESIGGLDFLQTTGFFLWDYSSVFFMVCVMYTLTARYMRIREELRLASLKIFDAHEDERKRVARELHDGIGQSLQSVKLRLKMLESHIEKGGAVKREDLSELTADVSQSIEEIRAVAMDLRPSFLENTDFSDAVHWHAVKMQEQAGVAINVYLEGLITVNPGAKENLYRIYQEALSNALKHSEASAIHVMLSSKNSSLLLEISDDGKGFNPARPDKKEAGIGLSTIKERVELLGGILRIKSSDANGTVISIEVPAS
jgi:signal transduction histidine kinase